MFFITNVLIFVHVGVDAENTAELGEENLSWLVELR